MDIPRKMSVSDPTYKSYWVSRNLKIFLNGREQRKCIAYDMDAGTVTRYLETDDGQLVIVGDEAIEETFSGIVTVEDHGPK